MQTRIAVLLIALSLGAAPAWSKDEKSSADKVQDGAVAVVNEIGKGLQAVGKAVGPAVEKAERTVRGNGESNKEKKKEK